MGQHLREVHFLSMNVVVFTVGRHKNIILIIHCH